VKDLKGKILTYNKDEIKKDSELNVDFFETRDMNKIYWVDILELKNTEGILQMCKNVGIHHLISSDILNKNQIVKIDNYDDCIFIVLKLLAYDSTEENINAEHISILIKDNCVFTFQESGRDLFAPVREKILTGRENIRKLGVDYLCYELLDTVVDNYFNVIDMLGDEVDSIEEELIAKPEKSTLQRIYIIKRKLMVMRKSTYPLRELLGGLFSTDSGIVGGDVKIYFHAIYDHLIQIVDSIETYQDILSNMMDIYLSSISNKTNDTMKILTIFSSIFIPLTFLAGVYGMNFKNLPELDFRFGYTAFWGISIVIAVIMLMFFHRKKWF
jgi:magnesium transporter